eukprot:2893194-Ditylum_brightwellii.AAC.1
MHPGTMWGAGGSAMPPVWKHFYSAFKRLGGAFYSTPKRCNARMRKSFVSERIQALLWCTFIALPSSDLIIYMTPLALSSSCAGCIQMSDGGPKCF